uniref:Uncharacterized protein n=1 Tax=Panagrolaimus davidi TaxID=227884 RepID=A0A914QUJ0_9BILA
MINIVNPFEFPRQQNGDHSVDHFDEYVKGATVLNPQIVIKVDGDHLRTESNSTNTTFENLIVEFDAGNNNVEKIATNPPEKLSDKIDPDCCISVTAGWITIGVFMFLSILIILACLYCMHYFQKKEKQKCNAAVKEYNENYQKTSKMPKFDSHFMPPPPAAVMTPQAKMDQLMKNMEVR